MTQETYNTALGPINHLHKKGKVAFKSRGTLILLTFQDLQTNIQFNTSCRGKNVPIILQIISEGREATSTCEEVICCILQQCVMKNLLKKYYYQHWQKQNVISLSHQSTSAPLPFTVMSSHAKRFDLFDGIFLYSKFTKAMIKTWYWSVATVSINKWL